LGINDFESGVGPWLRLGYEYLIDYGESAGVWFFWACVCIGVLSIIAIKFSSPNAALDIITSA